jgi:hypothetical protein
LAAIFAFRCTTCGEIHEGSPSFAFPHPWHYGTLTEEDRKNARLTSDLCAITHDRGTDRFVRVVLEIPIHGVREPFLWGVWASLSEKSCKRYVDTWDDPDENDAYFGWFCNRLPYYPDTLGLQARVRPRGGARPCLELERNGHLLAEHLYEGISVQLAQEIAEHAQHKGSS